MSPNAFKHRLQQGERQFGLFCMSLTAQTVDAIADPRFDFLLFDAEHTPTSLPTRYGRDSDYYASAQERVCLLLQIESGEGLRDIAAIASVDGVDGVFIGPVDLATDLGHLAKPNHPEVVAAVLEGVGLASRTGKGVGILAGEAQCSQYLAAGASMVCLGSDLGLLVRAADELAGRWVGKAKTGGI